MAPTMRPPPPQPMYYGPPNIQLPRNNMVQRPVGVPIRPVIPVQDVQVPTLPKMATYSQILRGTNRQDKMNTKNPTPMVQAVDKRFSHVINNNNKKLANKQGAPTHDNERLANNVTRDKEVVQNSNIPAINKNEPTYTNKSFGPANAQTQQTVTPTAEKVAHTTSIKKTVFNPYKKPPQLVTITQSPTNSLSRKSVSSNNSTPTSYRSPTNKSPTNKNSPKKIYSPRNSNSASSFKRVSPPTRPYNRNNMGQNRPTNPNNISPNRVPPSPSPNNYRRVQNPYIQNNRSNIQAPSAQQQNSNVEDSEATVFRFDLSQMSTSSSDSEEIKRRNSEESFERALARVPLPEKITKMDMVKEKYKNVDVGVTQPVYVDKDNAGNILV